jgi:hypothetical protein
VRAGDPGAIGITGFAAIVTDEARRSGPRHSKIGLLYGTVAKKASLGSVVRSTAIPKNGWKTLPLVVMPS